MVELGVELQAQRKILKIACEKAETGAWGRQEEKGKRRRKEG